MLEPLKIKLKPVEKRYSSKLALIALKLELSKNCTIMGLCVKYKVKPYQARRLLALMEKRELIFRKRLAHNQYEYHVYRKRFKNLQNYRKALESINYIKMQNVFGGAAIRSIDYMQKFVRVYGNIEYDNLYDAFEKLSPQEKNQLGDCVFKGKKLKEWAMSLPQDATYWEGFSLYISEFSCKECIKDNRIELLEKSESDSHSYSCSKCGFTIEGITEDSTLNLEPAKASVLEKVAQSRAEDKRKELAKRRKKDIEGVAGQRISEVDGDIADIYRKHGREPPWKEKS